MISQPHYTLNCCFELLPILNTDLTVLKQTVYFTVHCCRVTWTKSYSHSVRVGKNTFAVMSQGRKTHYDVGDSKSENLRIGLINLYVFQQVFTIFLSSNYLAINYLSFVHHPSLFWEFKNVFIFLDSGIKWSLFIVSNHSDYPHILLTPMPIFFNVASNI